MGFDAVGVASRVHVFSDDSVDGGCGGGLVTRNKGTYTFLPLSRRLLFEQLLFDRAHVFGSNPMAIYRSFQLSCTVPDVGVHVRRNRDLCVYSLLMYTRTRIATCTYVPMCNDAPWLRVSRVGREET